MVSKNARCELCFEIVDENSCEIWEDRSVYCHNPDWIIPGGTCWEKRVVEDAPEMEPWLWYGFDCDGCELDPDTQECTCTSDGWKGYGVG